MFLTKVHDFACFVDLEKGAVVVLVAKDIPQRN